MELPKRKANRLAEYDYSAPGAYFITFCTKDKACILWDTVGASIARPKKVPLSAYGMIVDEAVRQIPMRYPVISLDQYVVMPNHVHLLLQIHTDIHGQRLEAPSVSMVIQQLKGAVTKRIGYSIWQKLFHDHVIRNERDYQEIWKYIDNNPVLWEKDCFYQEGSV